MQDIVDRLVHAGYPSLQAGRLVEQLDDETKKQIGETTQPLIVRQLVKQFFARPVLEFIARHEALSQQGEECQDSSTSSQDQSNT